MHRPIEGLLLRGDPVVTGSAYSVYLHRGLPYYDYCYWELIELTVVTGGASFKLLNPLLCKVAWLAHW